MFSQTAAELLARGDVDLDRLNATLERLWLERHHLHACVRDVRVLRRSIELARAAIDRGSQ